MKTKFPLLATACTVLLAGAANSQAQYSSDVNPSSPPPPNNNPPYARPVYYYEPYFGPFYVGGELGGSIMHDLVVKNNGTKLRFDPGTSFDVNFGCYLAPPVSLEFETGVIWNSIQAQNNQPLTAGENADLYQVPLLVNLVLHLPLVGGGQFYAGAGVGGVVSDLYLSDSNNNRHHDDYNADSDASFAYQGMAGFKFPVNRRMEVGVGYKFLGTLDHTWFNGDANFYTHTGPTYTHSILATFTFNF
jgi:opacity protein-like surface antigen